MRTLLETLFYIVMLAVCLYMLFYVFMGFPHPEWMIELKQNF